MLTSDLLLDLMNFATTVWMNADTDILAKQWYILKGKKYNFSISNVIKKFIFYLA